MSAVTNALAQHAVSALGCEDIKINDEHIPLGLEIMLGIGRHDHKAAGVHGVGHAVDPEVTFSLRDEDNLLIVMAMGADLVGLANFAVLQRAIGRYLNKLNAAVLLCGFVLVVWV